MIYLKFVGTQNEQSIRERVFCTSNYCVAPHDHGVRVYYEPGMWEEVSPRSWLNCFVMSETGKTIDKIEAVPK